jgi:nucleotide-binding universal stress UspA family protein
MKKVLVAVDGSDKSLEATDYAMSIANKERVQLIMLKVLDTEPGFTDNQRIVGPQKMY